MAVLDKRSRLQKQTWQNLIAAIGDGGPGSAIPATEVDLAVKE